MNNIETLGDRTMRKIKRRIIPFILLLYVIAYLDRVNIGYAALDMNIALGITPATFGLISGLFFIPYALLEIPSNMMGHHFGIRIWICRIMVTWGIISSLTIFVQNATQLGIIRCLLGVAEAGFVPGITYYLTRWFPEKDRAKAIALFMIGVPLANVIGAPISTWIITHIGWAGLPGWRWLFLLEGVPAFIFGIVTFFYLSENPAQAKWLSQDEKDWLSAELLREEQANSAKAAAKKLTILQVFKSSKVWRLAFIYSFYVLGGIAVTFWLPQIIQGFSSSLSISSVGLLAMIPYILTICIMVPWARHSDKTGERKLHTALPPAIQVFGLLIVMLSTSPVMKFIGISIVVAFLACANGPFWTLPQLFLSGASAAVGIAIINSVCNLGGFIGNYVVGYTQEAFGSNAAFIFLASCSAISFLLTITMKKEDTTSIRNTQPMRTVPIVRKK